jgi:hypothetical protein
MYRENLLRQPLIDKKHISSVFIAVHFSELKKNKSRGGL